MNYILRPKKEMHGKSLKSWYRRVYKALIGNLFLPRDWVNHPIVEVPADDLSAVMDCLYKQSIF